MRDATAVSAHLFTISAAELALSLHLSCASLLSSATLSAVEMFKIKRLIKNLEKAKGCVFATALGGAFDLWVRWRSLCALG